VRQSLLFRLRQTRGMRLSTRLILIIATCLIPTIALQVVIGVNQWNERRDELGTVALHQAELLAGDMASISEGARIFLSTVAEFQPVRAQSPGCDLRLASLRRNVPSFAFVAVVDANGGVQCASDPAMTRITGATWISDATRAQQFTAGRYAQAPDYPGGFLPFFLPLPATGGQARATLVAALDLVWLSQHLFQLRQTSSNLLAAGVLTVADADGVILGRSPTHAQFVGKRFPDAAMLAVHADVPGSFRLVSIDGVERVIGYIPPAASNHNVTIAVGFNETEVMSPHRTALIRAGLLLAATALLACILTWLVARRFITRPTNALLAAARRWREGDLMTRAPNSDQRSEFGLIAAACNEMAAVLSKRDEELREYADQLEARVTNRTEQLLISNNRLQVEMEERQNTQAALVQSQKLQAAGRLAGGIAHDFNNLLATIQGSLDLLCRSVSDSKQRAWIERALGAVTRGAQLTARLLAFSRRRRLTVQATDVNRMVSDMAALLGAATLGHRIRVETRLPPDVWPAMAEPSQVEAAILNLALNARDAMPDGGVLTLSTRNEVITAGEDGIAAGEYVGIAVSDTGTGMTDDIAVRALEPFFTTKGLSGTGLGLSQVHAMVQESGGAIRIRTQPGEGTTITLLLPKANETAVIPNPNAGISRARGRQTVLVVDDDPDVMEVTADMLRQLGYCANMARSGQEALDKWDKGEITPDLVILDFAMPVMNGLVVATELRERGFTGPIVLATGYADLTEIQNVELGTLQDVLSKPYSFEDLERVLASAETGTATRMPLSLIEAGR